MASALRMQGIRKRYGPRTVLAGFDLELDSGQTIAVTGPNGCGKSTLLAIASTLLRPDAGQLEVQGHDASRAGHEARRHLGVVLQHAPLDDGFTPAEQVAWWARLRGVDAGAASIAALLDGAGLAASAHRPAAQLSRGQRQRLAILLALAHDPAVAVLDEPFTGLDDAGAAWLEGLLQARRGGRATLVALHDAAQAARLADRIVRLAP